MSEVDARDDTHSGPTVDACQWRLRYEVGYLIYCGSSLYLSDYYRVMSLELRQSI